MVMRKVMENFLVYIAASLGDACIHHINGIHTITNSWEELNKVFGLDTKNCKVKFFMQLYGLKHLDQYKNIKQQLAISRGILMKMKLKPYFT